MLLTDSPEVLPPALEALAALGFGDVGAHVLGPGARLTARCRRVDWAALHVARAEAAEGRRPSPVVVDVRGDDEWRGGHLDGAVHLPLPTMERTAPGLPAGELWVYCRTGQRAGIAASLLQRLGHDVIHIDDRWERAQGHGTPTAA